jgi:hypothetical protein
MDSNSDSDSSNTSESVAGELEIISSRKIKIDERNTRLSLLKKIVYYSNIYQWKALLDFYDAFLRQIETGVKTWKDNPGELEVPGADPGFQVRGAHFRKIAPSGGRREYFWGISCEKSPFYAKKSYLFQF